MILAFAIFALFLGLRQIVEIFEGIDTLIVHKGIVNKKYLSNKYFTSRGTVSKKEEQDSVWLFQFRIVGDTALYTASRYAKGLDNLIQVEDSLFFIQSLLHRDLAILYLMEKVVFGRPTLQAKFIISLLQAMTRH